MHGGDGQLGGGGILCSSAIYQIFFLDHSLPKITHAWEPKNTSKITLIEPWREPFLLFAFRDVL